MKNNSSHSYLSQAWGKFLYLPLLAITLLFFVNCSSLPSSPPNGFFTHSTSSSKQENKSSKADKEADIFVGVPQSELTLLDKGGDGFLARLALIENARDSIDAQYYLWDQKGTGLILVDRLLAAADRGVKVRLLVDEYLLEPEDIRLAALSAHKNIEFRFYNPSAFNKKHPLFKSIDWILHFRKLDHRMHNKLFIADDETVIMGGRNIGDDYFGAHKDSNFRDFDVIFRGHAVSAAQASFTEFWNAHQTKPISYRFKKKVTSLQVQTYGHLLDEAITHSPLPESKQTANLS